jgi:hypothetical protein
MNATETKSARSERRALWVLRVAGSAVLLLSAVLLIVMPAAPVSENVPGFQTAVVGFELASRPEHVLGILGGPTAPERAEAVRRMDLGNRIDFLYMIAYPALYAGIALLLAAHGRLPRPVATLLLVLPVIMALGDALENHELLLLSGVTDPGAMTGALGRLRLFTLVKWYAIYGASGIAAPFIWRERGWWRWSAFLFGGAALLGLASIVYLPAIEHGSMALIVAWVMTYVHAWRTPVVDSLVR